MSISQLICHIFNCDCFILLENILQLNKFLIQVTNISSYRVQFNFLSVAILNLIQFSCFLIFLKIYDLSYLFGRKIIISSESISLSNMESTCKYDRYSLDLAGVHLQGKYVFYGLIVGVVLIVLKALNRYLSGSWCHISKDLTGKNVVITGGNDGIGRETAKRLVQLGARVIIGSRDEKRNRQTVEELSKIGKGRIVAFRLDLADKASIQDFAGNVNKQIEGEPLQYLLNNAGISGQPQLQKTKQNLEMQIGVNHFGHFYLTYLLWEKLKSSKNPRIVNVSSMGHESNISKNFGLDFDNLHFQNGGYNGFAAYIRSKKANVLFAKELQKRMDQEGIKGVSVSLHPGCVKTGITKQYIGDSLLRKIFHILIAGPFIMLFFTNLAQGAQTSLYCTLQDDQKLTKGGYYSDCRLKKTKCPYVNSPQIAQRLWIQSEKAFGIKFNL